MGGLALAFAAAPGWKHFKTFAWIAFSAAIYSAGNSVFAGGVSSLELVPWVARFNAAVACAHVACWTLYVRIQYGDPIRRLDRAVVAVLGGVGVMSLIPGLAMTNEVELQHVAWAGVTYQIPRATLLGSLIIAGIPLALIGPMRQYMVKARAGAPGARSHILGFSVFFASALNEVAVALSWVDGLYLADLGFLAAVVSVSAEMTYRVTGDARRLQVLSQELSKQVEDRTRELSATRNNLVHAERLAELGRLSASIGHEINNPLSYVIGNLEYISVELKRRNTAPEILAALSDVASGADRIRKIVGELRAFSRGSETERRELLHVEEVLETAIKLVWGELRHRARLERHSTATPAILGDSTKLTQVFVNVLMNAAQAIPEERAGQPDAVVTVRSLQLSEQEIAVEISDTGVGVDPRDRPRLFEPFFSTKPHDKGTGLGLFVSLGIVTALGGRIDLESPARGGTTVRITLPVARGIHLEPERTPTLVVPRLQRQRVLVIDDDVLVARTLARQLSDHSVEVVSSGREALTRLSSSGADFDLVLCDLMMPEVTGMDVYEQVERNLPHLAPRFVFISGGGVTERSRHFIERHAERVLPKPIDGRALFALLSRQAPSPVDVQAAG